jgi:hypothetical protein
MERERHLHQHHHLIVSTVLHVAFRYGDTRLFARLVCLIRGGDSAHCEGAFPTGDGEGWLCVSSSWVDGGPRHKLMPLPPDKWRVYRTDLPPGEAVEWLERQKGGYGWWKLIRFALPFIRPSFGGPICTEAVAQMLGLGHSDSWDLRTLEAAIRWRYGPPLEG